jgi:hypothetical protein
MTARRVGGAQRYPSPLAHGMISGAATHYLFSFCKDDGFAEFIIGPAEGRTRWLDPSSENRIARRGSENKWKPSPATCWSLAPARPG